MTYENESSGVTRRGTMFGMAAGGAAILGGAAKAANATEERLKGGAAAIPELAPHWQELDLREILSRPAAFMSVSQVKSLYEPWGVQAAERHWERGSLPATVKAAKAARAAGNFVSFNWIGYPVYRPTHPVNDFDAVQYASWTAGADQTEEQAAADNDLADDLQALVRPGDNEFSEVALQCAWFGTPLPLELTRKQVQPIVLTGIHLDWCIEGNARVARDNGFLPIVIGDACGCVRPDQEAAAMDRINAFFAPVISSDEFVRLVS
ncbi:isochorismatase family protein [Salipiger mucosus]|uniref:Isochorismatase hydrolase n=1 Tax=Salipiger mucosus DSM 16094 TaxID=1123237 RepID=S9QVF8_9RHOB|nr:isochorismatase family protein [Salipiger mucosus]EPX83542.1 isochorismatase hydrolase [Salipiger mucosus DSM 16094]